MMLGMEAGERNKRLREVMAALATGDRSATFDLYAETARFTSDYAVEPSVGVDAGGFVRVWRGLAAGVAFTSHSDARDIAIDASLPHPLKFNSNRSIEGTASGDQHDDTRKAEQRSHDVSPLEMFARQERGEQHDQQRP